MIKRILFLLTLCLSLTSTAVYASPELEKAFLGRWYSKIQMRLILMVTWLQAQSSYQVLMSTSVTTELIPRAKF
jgi:hypothetical protein